MSAWNHGFMGPSPTPEPTWEVPYPDCKICGGPNDMAEVCVTCAKTNDPYAGDTEASGGWNIQR